MFTTLEYKLLQRISPKGPAHVSGKAYANKSKISVLLGNDVFALASGKIVLDFGCGEGSEAIELAQNGASKVIGIDTQEVLLKRAEEKARRLGVGSLCEFCGDTEVRADIIISIDSFEHFTYPERVLRRMHDLLRPGGMLIGSFGPTWYHPYGGHLFSVFPWAHLLFSEDALIRWRAGIRNDGASSFGDVEGGLNQMTISRFEGLVTDSRFQGSVETVPIRKLSLFHNHLTREYTTSIVRFKLIRQNDLGGRENNQN
jgi:SAM-dependent methyltransferase